MPIRSFRLILCEKQTSPPGSSCMRQDCPCTNCRQFVILRSNFLVRCFMNLRVVASASVAAFVLTSCVFAQDTTGVISGTVVDASGAIVPGADVRIRSEDTGFARAVQTGELGDYRIPFVPVGVYDITVQRQGFKTQLQKSIRAEILQTRTVNFTLEVGATTETVNVEAYAPLLETETSQAGTVIKTEQVSRLPLNVRQFMQLAFLS